MCSCSCTHIEERGGEGEGRGEIVRPQDLAKDFVLTDSSPPSSGGSHGFVQVEIWCHRQKSFLLFGSTNTWGLMTVLATRAFTKRGKGYTVP